MSGRFDKYFKWSPVPAFILYVQYVQLMLHCWMLLKDLWTDYIRFWLIVYHDMLGVFRGGGGGRLWQSVYGAGLSSTEDLGDQTTRVNFPHDRCLHYTHSTNSFFHSNLIWLDLWNTVGIVFKDQFVIYYLFVVLLRVMLIWSQL